MAFADCIISARDQGAISREEADDLVNRYERFKSARAGDDRAARADLAADLTEQAERKRRLAELQEAAVTRIEADISGYRTPGGQADILGAVASVLANENARLAGFPSVNGRANAVTGYVHARLEELLHDQRRTWLTGRRPNKMRMDAIVDAAYGGTDDVAARGFWDAYRKVNDELVGLFNAAGGQLREMENFLPQKHDARKLAKAKEARWVEFTLPRLDRERMLDPFTDRPFTDERLREALSVAYRRLVTDGWSDRDPSIQRQGRGALANQRGESRFLIFKDAPAWREYQATFGTADTFATLMDHLSSMAKDVAALERLGPNPAATVEWMKQVVRSEAAKRAIGDESLFDASSPALALAGRLGRDVEQRTMERAEAIQNKGQKLIDSLWGELRGGAKPENMFVADFFAGARNLLTGIQLGSTFWTAAVTDPFIQARARQFSGLPVAKVVASMARQLSGANGREIMRAGIVVEDAMHHLRLDARSAGLLDGAGWTRVLPDRVLAVTGLTPWTQMGRRALAADFMSVAADEMSKAHGEVLPAFRRYLAGYGIGEREWDVIRTARAHEPAAGSAGLLRPVDIADTARSGDAFEIAMRYSEAMHALMEDAVPQGSVSTRAAMRGDSAAGTVMGELRRSMIMYLSFSHSFMTTTLRATAQELGAGTKRGAATYAGTTLIGLTLGGFAAVQIGQLLGGKDLAPANSAETWVSAMLKGGGLGLYGDYLLADTSKITSTPAEKLAGPLFGAFYDALKVAAPGAALRDNEKVNRSDSAVRLLERYMPGANTWYTRLAWQRLVTDQLHYLTNPNAHRTFRERERRLERESGQGYWWAPGETEPRRAPVMATQPAR